MRFFVWEQFSPAHIKYPKNYGQVVLSANAPPRKTSNFGWLKMQHISPPFRSYKHKSLETCCRNLKKVTFSRVRPLTATSLVLIWGEGKSKGKEISHHSLGISRMKQQIPCFCRLFWDQNKGWGQTFRGVKFPPTNPL